MSNKLRVKKRVSVHHDYHESVKVLLDRQESFTKAMDAKMKELVDRHNNMAAHLDAQEKLIKQVFSAAAINVGSLDAKLQQLSNECDKSLSGIDRNVLAVAEILKEVFGQFQQLDFFLHKLAAPSQIALEASSDELATIRSEATKWYDEVVSSAFAKVQQRFVELEQERMRKATEEQEAKERAEKAARDQEEADQVGQELKRADALDRSVIAMAGGPGADIPEGADIFGG